MSDEKEIFSFVEQKIVNARAVARAKTEHNDGTPRPRRIVFGTLAIFAEDFMLRGRDAQRWMLMPGLRGTGKSTLLAQLYRFLTEEKKFAPRDVLFVSADDVVGQLGCGLHDVLAAYEKLLGRRFESLEEKVVLLIDEVHFDPSWQVILKNVYERAPNVLMVVTGSSALALQSNLSADIFRRARIEPVEPLCFTEYLQLSAGVPSPSLRSEIFDALFRSPDAITAHERLSALYPRISDYASRFSAEDVARYLWQGSFPFTLHLEKEEAFLEILRVSRDVLQRDVQAARKFDAETLEKFPRLVTLLASWPDVSIDKLKGQLGVSAVTVTQMIEALRTCEMVKAAPTFGGVAVKTTRPPRYALSATAVKAAYLWNIGHLTPTSDQYGIFLEDLFIQYFGSMDARRNIELYRREGSGEADFIIGVPPSERIACELGYGQKDVSQLTVTMAQVECKYGLLIADVPLELKGDMVCVPKSYLLAY